jgi:hypothetical protein
MPSEPIPNRGDSTSKDDAEVEDEATPKTYDDIVVAAANTSVSLKRKGSEDSSKDEKEETRNAGNDAEAAVATKTSVPSKSKGAEDSSKAEIEEAPEAANDADDAVTAKTTSSPKEKESEDSSSDEKKAAPVVPIDAVIAAATNLMSKRKESEDSSKAECELAPDPPANAAPAVPIDAVIAAATNLMSKRKESEDSSKAECELAPDPPANAAIATKTSVSEDSSKDEKEGSSKDEKEGSSKDEKEGSLKDEKEGSSKDEKEGSSKDEKESSSKDEKEGSSKDEKGDSSNDEKDDSAVTTKTSVPPKRKGSEDSSNSEAEADADVTVPATARTSSSKKRKRKTDKEVLPPPLKLNHILFASPTSQTKKKRSRKPLASGMSSDPENDDGVEKVVKGSIASLVLQRIGKFKPCYVLSDSSDDEQPTTTGGPAAPDNAPSKTTPEKRPETRFDGDNNAFSRYEQSLSDEDESSQDSIHEPIFSRVTFRPTVVPQRRLLEQHNEQLAQEAHEASADHQTNGHGRATSAAQRENSASPQTDISARRDPDAMDVDETSSATSTNNSTKQTDRDIPTVADLKKHFLTSVERTFK